MSPDLGQGAAKPAPATPLPAAAYEPRQSRRMGRLGQSTNSATVAVANVLLRLPGMLPDAVAARALDPVADWSPPR